MIDKTKESDNAQAAWTCSEKFKRDAEVEREFLRGMYAVFALILIFAISVKLFS